MNGDIENANKTAIFSAVYLPCTILWSFHSTLEAMLSIYVRHTKACLPGLLAKGLSTEKQRAYKHCSCPKWYGGTYNGKRHPRATLDANTWEAAEKALAKIRDGGQPEISGVTVEKAIKAWLEEAALNHAAESTITQWGIIASKLLQFCERRRIAFIQNLDPVAINQWRGEWSQEKHHRGTGIKHNTAATRITVLKLLFKFVRRMRWIKEDPMALIKIVNSEEASEDHQTLPLDEEGDKNYQALLVAIPKYLGSLRRCIGTLATRPQHLVALTELMYETGFRWSDACRFEPRMMVIDPKDGWGAYTTKQTKTRRKGSRSLVTVAIPPNLVRTIQGLPPISARYLFWDGVMKTSTLYRSQVWPQLREAGKLAGIADMRPHRLRDSFAVNRLNEGMLIQDVSKLLGHTNIATTEEYYAPFVKSRKDALMGRRKALAAPAPAPVPAKVVPIKKQRAS